MELTHEFEVPVGIDRAWEVLNDIETIAPCLPGATVESVDGDDFSGSVKVKVGPIQLTYTGTVTFLERDEVGHVVRIDAKGTDRRGGGTAAAAITATLTDKGAETTAVSVHTDLAVTGKPAQFGRGVMADVGDKLLGQFADCLASEIITPQTEPAGAGATSAAQARAAGDTSGAFHHPGDDDVIDLFDVAGGSMLRRLAPVAAAAVALLLLVRWVRSR